MKKTKKVFDLGLYVDGMRSEKASDKTIMSGVMLWALECHGLTVEEMNEKKYCTSDSWMKEVEIQNQLTAREIEVLKSLKVLGFDWIARDEDGELYAYNSKPMKLICSFGGQELCCFIYTHLFEFITWQDEEATSIDELLSFVEGEQK